MTMLHAAGRIRGLRRLMPATSARLVLVGLALACLVAPATAICVGDCDNSGQVTVTDLMQMTNVALDAAPVSSCFVGDANNNGRIAITEIIRAVNIALGACPATFYRAPEITAPSGPRGDGTAVLPNGRVVQPWGAQQWTVDTLPLNLRVGRTGHVFVTNDGNGTEDFGRYLQVIDPQSLQVQRTPASHFFGLAVHPNGDRVYAANGPNDRVDVYAFDGTTLSPVDGASFTFPEHTFPMGLDISADGQTLFVTGFLSNTFWRVDIASGMVREANKKIGNFPYTVLAAGDRAYVSSWGINNGNNVTNFVPAPLPPTNPNASERSSVAVLDTSASGAPQLVKYIPIGGAQKVDPKKGIAGGSHPSAMALSPDRTLLYVTASNLDVLNVIDTTTDAIVAEVDLNVFGDGLQGLYPDAVAVSADGTHIYVADAGINAVQVIEADPVRRIFTSRGFIPTGWYPSALGLSASGSTLYVASAKGLSVGGNGDTLVDISVQSLNSTSSYIGHIIKGRVSAIDLATVDLEAATAAVRANNGFDSLSLETVRLAASPVPIEFGSPPSEQIKYVVYILKENRTYDQVFGDFERGNGEPRLAMFGEDVTPNQHALARQFAMGDNFFDDAEVSYPGHEWITQGNNNDWVEKVWPFDYNGLFNPSFNIETGQEGFCKNGYIFEALERQQISFRVYGEPLAFNSRLEDGIDQGGVTSTFRALIPAFGSLQNLVAHVDDLLAGDIPALQAAGVDVDVLTNEVWPNLKLDYPSNIIPDKTDVFRAELFMAELAQFSANNNLPHFLFIWLPNDHTFGAAPANPTPRTAVADNDRGLGMVVDALSHSPFWPQMAIFVTEDDAQDGQDHVSAHRTLDLVISPYAKRGYISSEHHSNVGMLKTMELLLGAQPMSQYDRYATDMRDYFTTTPDLTPFTAVAMRVRPEKNPDPTAAPNALLREAAEVSSTLNLSSYDEAGPELSRVLWLVHVGERVERQRRLVAVGAMAMLAALVLGGIAMQRRRRVA